MSIPKLSAVQLVEMAYRGAEDGHPDEWHRQMTQSARVVELMKEAADKARNNPSNHQKNFVRKQKTTHENPSES